VSVDARAVCGSSTAGVVVVVSDMGVSSIAGDQPYRLARQGNSSG